MALHPAMQEALALAAQARCLTPPNPAVGCVITAADGRLLGRGATQQVGGPHAEIMALRDAAARGSDLRGATAWVTLEPCCHHGRTGPCCEALIEVGIARVVASVGDPNPLVAGRGIARLRAAGVEVLVGEGAEAARDLNIGFFSRMLRGRPWVRMKAASSLDGRTALSDGTSQWITSPAAREDGHRWRARAGALLTGIGTVLEDDPRLDVRTSDAQRQPPVVVVDSRLETPPAASILIAHRPRWICCAARNDAKEQALRERGAEILHMPGPGGKVDLAALLTELARREVNELHVEAGHKLNASMLREQLVDELLIYVAPALLGEGRPVAALGPVAMLSEALRFEFTGVEQVGPDLRLLVRVPGRRAFLG